MSKIELQEFEENSLQPDPDLYQEEDNFPKKIEKEESRGSKTVYLVSCLSALVALIAIYLLRKKVISPLHSGPRVLKSGVTYYLIPHSHDDLGWLETVKYYYERNVTRILNSSISALMKDPSRIFTYTEVGFLRMWADGRPDRQRMLKHLVSNGQLEMLNGGVSAHDNACPYYDDIVTNYEYGREWLYQTVGALPRSGWLIDPFGYSLTTTRLYSEMGDDNYVFNRITSITKRRLMKNGQQAFNWIFPDKPEFNMLTTVLGDHYNLPGYLRYDYYLAGVVTDIFDSKFDIMKIIDNVLEYYKLFNFDISFGDLDIALIPFGDDFWYSNYTAQIVYLDQLVVFAACNNITGRVPGLKFVQSNVNGFFTAFHDKLKEKRRTVKDLKQVVRGDFFPLVDSPKDTYGDLDRYKNENHDPVGNMEDSIPPIKEHYSWSGYFTTNPYQKKTMKSFGQLTRYLKSFIALEFASKRERDYAKIEKLIEAMDWPQQIVGIYIHHDAITGTARYRVVEDYLQMISNATIDLERKVTPFILEKALGGCSSKPTKGNLVWPDRENVLPSLAQTYLLVTPLTTTSTYHIRSSVESKYPPKFLDTDNRVIPSTVGCAPWGWCDFIVNVPLSVSGSRNQMPSAILRTEFSEKASPHELNQWRSGFIQIDEQNEETMSRFSKNPSNVIGFIINDDKIVIENKRSNDKLEISLHHYRYDGNSTESVAKTGKYFFTSSHPAEPMKLQRSGNTYQFDPKTGSLYLHILYPNGIFNLTVSYRPEADAEDRFSVRIYCGKLPGGGIQNTNYVIRYYSPINSGELFTTDSNGLEKVERIRFDKSKVIDENYYPLTKFMYLEDSNKRLSILVDRACGGFSPRSGELEVMFHRVFDLDDGLGTGESVEEPYPVNILHRIVLEDKRDYDALYRKVQVSEDEPILFFGLGSSMLNCSNSEDISRIGVSPYLKVQFDIRSKDRIMFRLTNLHDTAPLVLDIEKMLLDHYSVAPTAFTAMSLDFINTVTQLNHLPYLFNKRSFPEWKGKSIELKPLEIRTFKIGIS